nr:excinuclease ABC subunit C [Neisseria animalis]
MVLLAWYELHATMENVFNREKQLKKWQRNWKLRLIEENNPNCLDLWAEIMGEE